jgi:hypothetical protein
MNRSRRVKTPKLSKLNRVLPAITTISDAIRKTKKNVIRPLKTAKLRVSPASKLEPNKPDGYFWFGANLGEQGNRNPLRSGVRSVEEIPRRDE